MAYSALGQGLLRLAALGGRAMGAAKPFVGKAVGAARPIVTKLGVPAAVGATVGGVRGAQQGGVGGAVGGALGGGLIGSGLGALPVVGGLGAAGQAAVGGVGGLFGPSSMGIAGNAANTVGGAAALQMQNVPNINSGNYMGGGAGPVPTLGGAHGQMVVGPDGNIYQQIDPTGYRQGGRFGSGLDTMQDISNANRWFQSRFPQREAIMKADFNRELAAAQLRRNMDLAQNITQGYASSARNIAEQNNQNMGTLLANQNKFF